MIRPRSALSLLALAMLAGALPLAAQGRDRGLVEVGAARREAGTRGGFYGTLGLGGGRERYAFSDEPELWSEDLTKPTLTLRLGGTPSTRVRIGGEIFAWGNEAEEGFQSFTTLALTGQFYLNDRQGLYLKGGLGFARSGTDFNDGGSAFESGFGTTIGAGWDFALSPSVAITPTVDFYRGKFTRRGEATLTEQVVNIGVSLTFQTGHRR